MAHVETDECGGPEFFTNGTKLLLVAGPNGKVLPREVQQIVDRRKDIHYPRPRVLSLTQATEAGTVYTIGELDALRETARKNRLHVHMDGARFANAIARLGVAPKEVTWKVGVDVLCFGGTKNGMPVGEAVIFFDRDLARDFDYRCKQAGQLASKMRFLTAPWVGMLESGAWLGWALHANVCAGRLAAELAAVPGVEILFPTEANAVFLKLPPQWVVRLRQLGWKFYTFIGGGARFMCSWATTDDDIQVLVADLRQVAAGG
jgi:threonine aldolase